MLRSKMATLLTIVSAMLISAGMTWQQRLLFIGGIAFGVVVEALPTGMPWKTESTRPRNELWWRRR